MRPVLKLTVKLINQGFRILLGYYHKEVSKILASWQTQSTYKLGNKVQKYPNRNSPFLDHLHKKLTHDDRFELDNF